MKSLIILAALCGFGLFAHVWWGPDPPNPFADGHLACMPMPPPIQLAQQPLLPPPKLKPLSNPQLPEHIAVAKLEIFDAKTAAERMVETRQADQTDWGITRPIGDAVSAVLASVGQPRIMQPVAVNTTPTIVVEMATPVSPDTSATQVTVASAPVTSASQEQIVQPTEIPDNVVASVAPVTTHPPMPIAPNLYLPEGALDEDGALLTLIKPELKLYEEPNLQSRPASFTFKAGDRVRPLTRLRNDKEFDWLKIESNGQVWWAQAEYFIRVDPRNHLADDVRNIAIGDEAVDKDSALPVDYMPDDLVDLPRLHVFGDRDQRLRKEAAEAFGKMAAEAARQGLKLRVFSGFRDFGHQKKLFLEAIDKQGPKQNGTAAPGYSEHQLGTTIDISNADRHSILSGRFGETKEGRWLHDNAERFGFRNSYTSENSQEVGYKPEPWHYRYVGVRAVDASVAANR